MDEETNVVEFPTPPTETKEQIYTITALDGQVFTRRGYGLFLHKFLCISETPTADVSSDIKFMINIDNVLTSTSEDVPAVN